MKLRVLSLLGALLLGDAGCDEADAVPPVPTGCNPISLESCYLPYPSAFYEQEDATTATGVRLSFPAAFLPSSNGTFFEPRRLLELDGASPAVPIVVYFKDGIDTAALPTLRRIADSTAPSSTVVVMRFDTGDRVPLFVELDANAITGMSGDRQALMIRPQQRLAPATRYVVALRGELRDMSGRPLAAPLPFRALRDRLATRRPEVVALRDRYEEIFARLEAAGIPRRELVLAWDFTTASDASVGAPLLSMRDDALARVAAGGYGYTIASVAESPDEHLLREVRGTFTVPWYLDGAGALATLVRDARGQPQFQGTAEAPFMLHVPRCAATQPAPLRLLVFGHGLFGSAAGEMGSDYQRALIDQLCVVQIGTDWLGLSHADTTTTIPQVLIDLAAPYLVTDKLMQAHTNFHVLTELFLGPLLADPVMTREGAAGGTPLSDGSEVYYLGISDGAIQGTGYLALSPRVGRGVLNVGGGPWTLLMQRSSDFSALNTVIGIMYPDHADQQLLLAVWQSYWDMDDPVTWGGRILGDRVPGTPEKQVLLQEALGDAEVPNLATRYLARTIGVPGLEPLCDPPYGLPTTAGPVDSAFTQWDVHPSPLPGDTNVPPEEDNEAHQAVRRLPAVIAQIDAYFHPTGTVVQTCPPATCCQF